MLKEILAFIGPCLGAFGVALMNNADWKIAIGTGLAAGFGGNVMKQFNGMIDRKRSGDSE